MYNQMVAHLQVVNKVFILVKGTRLLCSSKLLIKPLWKPKERIRSYLFKGVLHRLEKISRHEGARHTMPEL